MVRWYLEKKKKSCDGCRRAPHTHTHRLPRVSMFLDFFLLFYIGEGKCLFFFVSIEEKDEKLLKTSERTKKKVKSVLFFFCGQLVDLQGDRQKKGERECGNKRGRWE